MIKNVTSLIFCSSREILTQFLSLLFNAKDACAGTYHYYKYQLCYTERVFVQLNL